MRKKERISPNYRGMLRTGTKGRVEQAVSGTQHEIAEMDQSARYGLEATERAYRTGGNEGDWQPGYHQDRPGSDEDHEGRTP